LFVLQISSRSHFAHGAKEIERWTGRLVRSAASNVDSENTGCQAKIHSLSSIAYRVSLAVTADDVEE
jgi:hypothetical protein